MIRWALLSKFDTPRIYSSQVSVPLAAILALTELVERSEGTYTPTGCVQRLLIVCLNTAGTMFELVQALNQGAETLRSRFTNSISLNAGCELFIAFVTLFPHESDVRSYPASCEGNSDFVLSELQRSQGGVGEARPQICPRRSVISRKNCGFNAGLYQRRLCSSCVFPMSSVN